METKIQKENGNYVLSITYDVKSENEKIFNLIATDEGFQKWFPQLRIKEKYLVFEMDDFYEEMQIIEYEAPTIISYKWDTAFVKFDIKNLGNESQIKFTEIIPTDFGNEYADAKKDMAGWLVQNHCIKSLLDTNELAENIKNLQDKYLNFVETEIEKID